MIIINPVTNPFETAQFAEDAASDILEWMANMIRRLYGVEDGDQSFIMPSVFYGAGDVIYYDVNNVPTTETGIFSIASVNDPGRIMFQSGIVTVTQGDGETSFFSNYNDGTTSVNVSNASVTYAIESGTYPWPQSTAVIRMDSYGYYWYGGVKNNTSLCGYDVVPYFTNVRGTSVTYEHYGKSIAYINNANQQTTFNDFRLALIDAFNIQLPDGISIDPVNIPDFDFYFQTETETETDPSEPGTDSCNCNITVDAEGNVYIDGVQVDLDVIAGAGAFGAGAIVIDPEADINITAGAGAFGAGAFGAGAIGYVDLDVNGELTVGDISGELNIDDISGELNIDVSEINLEGNIEFSGDINLQGGDINNNQTYSVTGGDVNNYYNYTIESGASLELPALDYEVLDWTDYQLDEIETDAPVLTLENIPVPEFPVEMVEAVPMVYNTSVDFLSDVGLLSPFVGVSVVCFFIRALRR